MFNRFIRGSWGNTLSSKYTKPNCHWNWDKMMFMVRWKVPTALQRTKQPFRESILPMVWCKSCFVAIMFLYFCVQKAAVSVRSREDLCVSEFVNALVRSVYRIGVALSQLNWIPIVYRHLCEISLFGVMLSGVPKFFSAGSAPPYSEFC